MPDSDPPGGPSDVRKGRRALLRTEEGDSRVLAVAVTRLEQPDLELVGPEAVYLVVLRPAGEHEDREEHAVPSRHPQANERASLERALVAHRWKRAETARALGISRSTLWRRMRAVGLP